MLTFTRVTPTYDPATDTRSTVTTTISGNGMEIGGDPARYQALGLVLSEAPTLLFFPTDYGLQSHTEEFVRAGDTVQYNGRGFTVRDVRTLSPDGVVIAARIVVVA